LILAGYIIPVSSLNPSFEDFEENVVLITGFKPFDVYDVNPSEIVALQLNNTIIENVTIKGFVLPVNYTTAPAKMKQLITRFHPKVIISLGLAGKADKILIEKMAVNLRINPDVKFPLLTLKRINTSGPWIQLATYDVPTIIENIEKKNISVEQSYSAGIYLCNAILYETLYYQKETGQSIPTGFIHLPQLDTQHPQGMSLETMIQAVTAAVSAHISM
jgi:pyroglutamyl-peptidase